MMQVESLAISRLLKGLTLTATLTEDILPRLQFLNEPPQKHLFTTGKEVNKNASLDVSCFRWVIKPSYLLARK